MSSPLFTASQFVKYWFRATGAHGLHSPFLFKLRTEVIKESKNLIPEIETIRKALRESNQIIDVLDFKSGSINRSTVGNVARRSLSQPRFSNFLRLLCEYLNAKTVLETGTSLGINARYLAVAETVEKVVTIEGSDIIHQLAKETFNGDPKIQSELGNLHELLEMNLVRHQPDLVFLDADHRASAVKYCLEKIMELSPATQCIVIHDIYWSKDMMQGWEEIVQSPSYNLTIDIFQAGIIFPNHPIEKQHFTLKF